MQGYPPGYPSISHQGKRKLIFPTTLGWDMLVSGRVSNHTLQFTMPLLTANTSHTQAADGQIFELVGCLVVAALASPEVWHLTLTLAAGQIIFFPWISSYHVSNFWALIFDMLAWKCFWLSKTWIWITQPPSDKKLRSCNSKTARSLWFEWPKLWSNYVKFNFHQNGQKKTPLL